MSRDTETWAAQRSSIVGPMWRSLFRAWPPRDANFYTNRDTTAKAEVKVHDLTKRGTSIKVELYADKERLGTLLIGRGSFTWKGKGEKRGNTFPWSYFASLFKGKSSA